MMKKKATTLLAVLLMGAIALTGCSAPHTVNGSAEAVSVNGTSVPLGELNFYLRYQQANMQNAYGFCSLHRLILYSKMQTDALKQLPR